MSIIDQEIKRLFLTLLVACIALTGLIWVAANSNAFFSFTSRLYNTVTGQKTYDEPFKYNLDKNKTYSLEVETNVGKMTFLLDKEAAPNTVNNLVNLVREGYYKNMYNGVTKNDRSIILGRNTNKSIDYSISEEINAKSLGLDKVTVGQYYDGIKDVYDKSLLDQNLSKTVMEFYESIGYKYNSDILSQLTKKGSLIMYSENPGSFKNEFMISTVGPIPQVEGRMTNFGHITSGEEVLDKINTNSDTEITINSLSILEK